MQTCNIVKASVCLLIGLVCLSGFNLISTAKIMPTTEQYKLLVIAPSEFMDALEPLKTHKELHGLSTKLVTPEDIYQGSYFSVQGRDNAEMIKYFLGDAEETWGIQYVLFVGGKEHIPVRYTQECYWGECRDYISDLYYADLYNASGGFCSWDSDGDNIFSGKSMSGVLDEVDLYPDIALGRLLCRNQQEVQTVVEKIIEYENTAHGQQWFNNLIACGGDDARLKWREKEFCSLFNREGGILWEGEYMGDMAADILSDFSAKKIYATGLYRLGVKFLNVNNINSAINDGAGFLLFIGHGTPTTAIYTNFPMCDNLWLPYPFGYDISHAADLNNGNKLPITVFGGCNCGDFDDIDNPIAWYFVQKENGGAIASFAATTGSIILFSVLSTETFTGHLTMSVFQSYAEGIDCLGDIWKSTINRYLDDDEAMTLGDEFSTFNWHNTLANNYVLEEWALFGDPSLKIGGYA
jgi:hypothetical protein